MSDQRRLTLETEWLRLNVDSLLHGPLLATQVWLRLTRLRTERPQDEFWQTLRIETIPADSLAMLICKALVPDSATENMGGWRTLNDRQCTWSNRYCILPVFLLH